MFFTIFSFCFQGAKVRFFFGMAKMFNVGVMVDEHEWQQMKL